MPTSDEQITQLFQRFMQAWTDNDAVTFGACFTEDADYVSYDGTRAVGRVALQDNHERLFRGVLAGSALVGDLESIRQVTADVALVHGTASVLMPWRSELPARRLSRQTLVVVRTEAGWRISALHNGRVRPVTLPAPDALPSRLSQAMSRAARRLGIGRPNSPAVQGG
ncbi:SgcJ/EcaC family oxidoreductase [Streptomyces cavernicola]|uniref:SgcJ/EcaC family oxidoreductase n=1 Tax=Streptomyces cavernicola TaxID=3043613 RepID=A0ABT6S2N9_9ACTN|nr:SgcJ/EcaC family oxidoreductase [Streptomyces sp. B-S-A6]MDI3402359.1 SgcJ/EcaC family oxidoreductase [Streptomyces sp. B-S-A6]